VTSLEHSLLQGTGVLQHAGFNNTHTGVYVRPPLQFVHCALPHPTPVSGNNTVSFNDISTIGKGDLSDMGCVRHYFSSNPSI
jgi:hypothetical protein